MSSREVKLKAKRFLKEFGVHVIDYPTLREILEKQGYSIVEFNTASNDETVSTLISILRVGDNVKHSRGFTFADNNHRIVFVHAELSEKEKLIVLAHEEGHIYCGHLASGSIIGRDVQEEYEANEFAHFVLNPDKISQASSSIGRHKKTWIIALICVGVLVIGGTIFCVIHQEQQYYDEYYITESGNKYHREDCIFVKDKTNVRRLTLEEFESGEYEPCKMCLPDQ